MTITRELIEKFKHYLIEEEKSSAALEKYMRDAKITQIYEGTVHIQKNEIITALIKEYASKEGEE